MIMSGKRIMSAIAILSVTFMAGGVAMSAYAGFQIYSSKVEQGRSYLLAAQEIWKEKIPGSIRQSAAIPTGDFLGTIYIPAISKTVNIFQGTNAKELSRGAGHYLGSVLPGVKDNSVIAGHRDTVFSSLGKVKLGAKIVITTEDGVFTYRVNRIRIVDASDRTVIVPTELATLTLSTCYPFNFIGAAPKRYIVVAKISKSKPSSITSI